MRTLTGVRPLAVVCRATGISRLATSKVSVATSRRAASTRTTAFITASLGVLLQHATWMGKGLQLIHCGAAIASDVRPAASS